MPLVTLRWDYDSSGPSPEQVEVFRDNVVVHTATTPITEYVDDVDDSISGAEYRVETIFGEFREVSETIFASFMDYSRYSLYLRLKTDSVDSANLGAPNLVYLESSYQFGEFGLITSITNGYAYIQGQYTQSGAFYDDLLLNSPTFTVEAKVKLLESQDSYAGIIDAGSGAIPSSAAWGLRLDYATGFPYFMLDGYEYLSTVPVNTNTPIKIAVVCDGSNIKFFINDVLDTLTPLQGPRLELETSYIYIGYRGGTTLYGEVCDVGVSTQALYG